MTFQITCHNVLTSARQHFCFAKDAYLQKTLPNKLHACFFAKQYKMLTSACMNSVCTKLCHTSTFLQIAMHFAPPHFAATLRHPQSHDQKEACPSAAFGSVDYKNSQQVRLIASTGQY